MISIRKNSKKCFIGRLIIGEKNPILTQSMTNTPTCEVEKTVNQCKQLIENDVDLIRITVPTIREIEAIKKIIHQLRSLNYKQPIIADVHFNPKIAEMVAPFADKVRINPGNFIPSTLSEKQSKKKFQSFDLKLLKTKKLLELCKNHNTAIRIGINHGSLDPNIVAQHGNTPHAMVVSALEWINICEYYQFSNFVLSLKASNVRFMLDSYMLLAQEMEKRGSFYPLHIGVTEAGSGIEGRAKSAAGIGALLLNGLGDTLRVSLTENPINEIIFAKKILEALKEIEPHHYFIDKKQVLHFNWEEKNVEKWIAGLSAICCYEHYKNPIHDLILNNRYVIKSEIEKIRKTVLQAVGIRYFEAEFISCPSCGRTKFDIETVTKKVKKKFSSYCGVKIGVMGCIVNGPGEMADAHYGVVGAGENKIIVYKRKNAISTPLPLDEALIFLEKTIQEDLNNAKAID